MDTLGLLVMFLTTALVTGLRSKAVRPAHRVCLPGPEIKQDNKNTKNQRKCLILGDSISIGYTSYVKQALEGHCTVYHAPWDVGDGGALDTKHGLDCLQHLMSSSTLHPLTYDAIVFNFGLHDINCDQVQDEFTSLGNYTLNLKLLKKFFLGTGAELAYALTTPILDDCDDNHLVVKYNKAAYKVMHDKPQVQVIDLYNVIIKKCGKPPKKTKAPDCPITTDSLIPHYTSHGYQLLADPVTKTFNKLLKSILTAKKKELEVSRDDSSGYGFPPNKHGTSEMSKKVHCKSKDNILVSACPPNSTCVANKMSGSGFACCLLPDAVDCKDDSHCCPKGSKCSVNCTRKKCSCLRARLKKRLVFKKEGSLRRKNKNERKPRATGKTMTKPESRRVYK